MGFHSESSGSGKGRTETGPRSRDGQPVLQGLGLRLLWFRGHVVSPGYPSTAQSTIGSKIHLRPCLLMQLPSPRLTRGWGLKLRWARMPSLTVTCRQQGQPYVCVWKCVDDSDDSCPQAFPVFSSLVSLDEAREWKGICSRGSGWLLHEMAHIACLCLSLWVFVCFLIFCFGKKKPHSVNYIHGILEFMEVWLVFPNLKSRFMIPRGCYFWWLISFSLWDVVTEEGEKHIIIPLPWYPEIPPLPQGAHHLARTEDPSSPLNQSRLWDVLC